MTQYLLLCRLCITYYIPIWTNLSSHAVSRRHLICSDLEIHQERFSAKSKSQRSAVVKAPGNDSDGKVNLHTTASYIFGIVQYFLKHALSYDVSDEHSMKYTDHLFANVTWRAKVSNTITFAVVSCHYAHPRHNDKLNSRLYALGYTKLIQVECGRYTKSVSTQSTPRCITCVSRLKRCYTSRATRVIHHSG